MSFNLIGPWIWEVAFYSCNYRKSSLFCLAKCCMMINVQIKNGSVPQFDSKTTASYSNSSYSLNEYKNHLDKNRKKYYIILNNNYLLY